MDTNTNNNSAPTSAEATAKKLKKQRIRQYIFSAIGVAILVWGIFEIACLFLDYKNTETSNDAQIEQYISPVNMRATGYIKKIYFKEHQDVNLIPQDAGQETVVHAHARVEAAENLR